jgi:hypothetical protein
MIYSASCFGRAHELTRVQQYRCMGMDIFANVYTTNAWILENQAIDQQSRVAQAIWGGQQMQQFAYFNVNGNYPYGDAWHHLYPANPSTGQVVGPANGHVPRTSSPPQEPRSRPTAPRRPRANYSTHPVE